MFSPYSSCTTYIRLLTLPTILTLPIILTRFSLLSRFYSPCLTLHLRVFFLALWLSHNIFLVIFTFPRLKEHSFINKSTHTRTTNINKRIVFFSRLYIKIRGLVIHSEFQYHIFRTNHISLNIKRRTAFILFSHTHTYTWNYICKYVRM